MYTAPYKATEEELNERAPLSIARWHLHTNLCLPLSGERNEIGAPGGKFGLEGSITTADAGSRPRAEPSSRTSSAGWSTSIPTKPIPLKSGLPAWTIPTACSTIACR